METIYLLDRIPKQLGDVEKASLPLQNFFKGSARRRGKAVTAATSDGSVATAPSAQSLIGTKRSDRIPSALNFTTPLYTLFLQMQSYLDDLSSLVAECWGSWYILSLVMRVQMGEGW